MFEDHTPEQIEQARVVCEVFGWWGHRAGARQLDYPLDRWEDDGGSCG